MKQKEVQKKKRKSRDLSTIFMVILLIAGYYILTFPTAADLLNNIYNQNSILSYNGSMASYSNEDIEIMKQNVDDYNNKIYEAQKQATFHYQGPTASDKLYTSLPTTSRDICTLRIPSIKVNVSVAHGTKDSTLQSEAGHLYGTSLPSDGENIHSVIAAHSALSTAKLFTDLTKVKKGDKFYVTMLNEEYEYKVDQIKVVLPEDDYQYEQVEEGKNYVTLYTCTPYGINTHRLLVRGEYVGKKQIEGTDSDFDLNDYKAIIIYSSEFALIILGPFTIMVAYAYHEQKQRKKHRKAKTQKKLTKAE